MKPAARRAIFERLRAANPDPRSELQHSTPYELLVAVVLSAQATDKSVNKATEKLFAVARTPAAIAALGVDGLTPYISSIGLYRNKARNVVALSEALLRDHGGQVPNSLEALQALPGVGRKTANVVRNVAFNEPVIPVDTHIFRVAQRTGLSRGRDADAVADDLERTVPEEFKLNAHHWLILHGRYVCVARKPLCGQCAIRDLCAFKDKTSGPAKAMARPAPPRTAPKTASPRRPRVALRPASAPAHARGQQPFVKTAKAASGRGGRKR